MKTQKMRGAALLTAGVLAVSSLATASAEAKTSRKDYKTGAIALGVIGAILAVKGKTVPAVVAGAGAYYAYKKSQDTDDRHYNRRSSGRSRYSYNDRANNSVNNDRSSSDDENVYPDATDNRALQATNSKVQTSNTRTSSESDNDISLD